MKWPYRTAQGFSPAEEGLLSLLDGELPVRHRSFSAGTRLDPSYRFIPHRR